MFRDPLIQKAWEVRQQSEHFPIAVLQEAATWLEEKYHAAPSKEIAVALALQYLILAMRQAQASPTAAKDSFARALRWREEADLMASAQRLVPSWLSLN
ncbi:MAG: hypothetical protein HOP18_04660 [Deltaproteobacteria bacterium]|nr:hypothetical protein [Deltaproteobacteria bacterium]